MAIILDGLSELEEKRFRYEMVMRYGNPTGVVFDPEKPQDIKSNGDFRALEELLDATITALYGKGFGL
jgi:hypothetical protein